MKHIFPLLIAILCATSTVAQVGINNTNPQAALDITAGVTPSNTDGILIPRVDEYPTGMTTAQDGMLAFLTGAGAPVKGFYYYSDGIGWLPLIGLSGTANTLDQAYDQGGNGVGATIAADSGAVSIAGEDGFQVSGTFGSGNDVDLTGAGTRMFFSPKKGAFRAGSINSTQWDHALIGDYSFAAGRNTRAHGENSIALGFDATSWNPNAIAIGYNVTANGDNTVAIGSFVTASSYGETALGLFGTNAVANSANSIDLADRVFSIGNGSDASNRKNALTIYKSGLLNINEEYNMPLVDGTTGQVMATDGAGNISFQTVSTGGTDTQNTLDQAYDEGGAGVGAVIDATDGAVRINGEDGFLITGTLGSGNTIDTEITGAGTRMFFNPNKAAFRAGQVDGAQWDNANVGQRSVAFGNNNTASGNSSTALGANNTSSGNRSLTIGDDGLSTGQNSVAMGQENDALNHNTFAQGYRSTASGNTAVAMGLQNNAPSWGEMTVGTFATIYTQNSLTSWNANDRVFTVGNGQNTGARSNALTVYKDGTLNINDAYNLPTTDGTVGQVMTTDGAGNLSFQNDATGNDWTITGNTGTNPSTNFIGTTDLQDFSIRTQNTEKVRITTQGQIETYNTGGSVFIGELAGENDDLSSNQNVAIGQEALQTNIVSNKNVAVGFRALNLSTTDSNTAVGWTALSLSTTGTQNTGIGYAALRNTTTGSDNTALGYQALNDNMTGFGNTAAGRISLNKNTSGSYNTANGFLSLGANTNGTENTAIGFNALSGNVTGGFNAAIGSRAGLISRGDNNTYLGFRAGDSDEIATENVYVGAFAGGGNYSGVTMTGQENKSGNIFVGYRSGYDENGSNKLYIENSDSATPLIYGEFDTNILRTNGTLQVNDPGTTGYAFPTTDGTTGQVLTTDGAGGLTFETVSAGGTDTQNTLGEAYNEGGAGAGAIITATDGAVTINGEDGLVVSGALGSGATITPGSNAQMFFNPNKAAFRAGYTFGATWHDANVGEYSFATGYQNIASGSSSTSMGRSSTASGSSATAIGDNAIASGNSSVAMGSSSEATALGAVAIGYGAEATGSFSTAMGQLNTSSGNHSFTAGIGNVASGISSSSIGTNNISSGNFTTTMGNENTASGIFSVAMGNNTVASGANSVTLGIENTAPSYAETVLGAYSTIYTPLSTVTSQGADRVFTVGNGTTDVNRSNALTVYKSGLVNINEEYNMPLTDGAAGQVMTTDGAGNVSFQTVSGGGGGSGWEITGNTGTNPATNFFGTTDAQPVALRLNNQEAGLLDGINNNYFIGTDAGSATAPNAAGVGLPTQQGGNNIGLGVGALISNTTGFQNTALGHYTMASLTTGAYNVGIGFRASINNIDGSFNTSIGFEAATFNLSAENNVAIGRSSLYNALSGENNVGVGAYAGHAYDAGDHNTFLGYRAGYSSGGTTGSNNVMIGANVSLNTASLSNKLMIDSNSAYDPTLLPLIYGEFDNDIVRINGALQVNNPAGTGYALPTTDGTNGQVMTTNGTGQLQWANDNINTASNGLTETSGNIVLGGALTNNTTINQGTSNMHFQMTSPGTADFRVIRGGGGNLLDINNTGVIEIGDISVLATNEPQFQVNGAAVEDFMASFTQNANNLDTDGIKIILRQETPNSLSNYVGFFKDLGVVQAGGITANFATGGVNYATTSDRRLKTKIKDINNSLELINKIQPRMYEYKANLGAIEYGFIAQELKEQFPQAVSGSPEGDVKKEPMMVDYGRLTPLLTAGIKELNQEIKNLKEENNLLKDKLSKLEQLEARLAALENSTNNFGNANNIPARLSGGSEEKK